MRRKKNPLEKVQEKDQEAKAKVSLVLQVLAGEKTISQACQDTGLKPLQYYKLEDRMVQAMVQTAKMPTRRGPGRDPIVEATTLAEKTEELRLEHRRLSSLMRISKKLFRTHGRKTRKYGLRKPRMDQPLNPGETEPIRRGPGRPPKIPTTNPAESKEE